MLRSLTLWWLASALLRHTAAQNVAATNSTPPNYTNAQVNVTIALGSGVISAGPWAILPLTNTAMNSFSQTGSISGPILVATTSSRFNTLNTKNVIFVSCESTSTYDAPSTVQTVGATLPLSVILFSNRNQYCTYSQGNFIAGIDSIWTTTNTSQGQWIIDNLQTQPAGSRNARIQSDRTVSGTQTNNTGPGGGSQPPSGGTSTAVAMIILYSITGVITALFLIIIVTGAIRAHRHPERYGPRNILGRPRQSRARGLARAIVDTLPIVKFGEQDPDKPPAADVEMGAEEAAAAAATTKSGGAAGASAAEGQTNEEGEANARTSREIGPASPSPEMAETKEEENPGCSICTDDFERGQDVRVLPCGHTFHPACVDPWLLNVSGTCPLCRVDLRPLSIRSEGTTTSDFMNAAEAQSHSRRGSFAAPLGVDNRDRRVSRFSMWAGILNPQRMEHASREERLAALRRVREERSSAGEDEAEARRRRRLTARLQDAFHIRTRPRSMSRSGAGSPEEQQAPVDVPAVPQVPTSTTEVQQHPPHASRTSLGAASTAEAPQLPPVSTLRSPMSMTFPTTTSTEGATSQSPNHDAPGPSTTST